MDIREIWTEYKAEFLFGAQLIAGVLLSCWLARYISVELYDKGISQIMNGCIATVSLAGAWLMMRHSEGIRVRRIWSAVLVIYAVFAALLLMDVTSFVGIPKHGIVSLYGWQMVVGNFLLWLFLLYLTELLRPGWMNVKRALLQSLPVWVALALDKLFAFDLRILLALYPVLLFVLLIQHIRKYREWCEENYSSMDDIDVQWIVRYSIMYLLDGALFFILCFVATIPVALTQQWLLLLLIAYSTEQILFRPDPRALFRRRVVVQELSNEGDEAEAEQVDASPEENKAYREALESWMAAEQPWRNPDFRLLDLRQVLPLNRTYLSQFINSAYGCNFYQFVTGYRIAEAKRLLREQPDMKMQDIAVKSGFSSPTVFARVFAREVGTTPTDWAAQEIENSVF